RMCSKLESSFARAVGERPNPSVVEVAAAIEHARRHARLLRGLGELLAHLCRLLGLIAREAVELKPARGRERAAGAVVDELGEEALVGAEGGEAGPLGRARPLAADAAMPAKTCFARRRSAHARFPTFLRTCSSR